ncbi:hypothetical protein D9613_003257 [Agrocybe pediades]|uniref:Uncharacterized protein n=1 Tax=Agrocybe pediades TaxID=84607 RepID=A0A8H4VM89_9AGAR|nr:hypothetical protein D9613_003257 [Agrocybe pediades]KAF9566235.1 hypothetical protein CPC08DRAFT_814819 [Agrocybe pediades]
MERNNKRTRDESGVDRALFQFINDDPNKEYAFSSERGSSVSEICRETGDNRDCVQLQMNAKRLFEAMQDQGFFCALPSDPNRTYMKCRPLPK